MKILVSYRGIPQSRGWATGDMVVKAFQELGHEAVSYGNYYQTNERLEGSRKVLAEDWDLLLFMECGDEDPVYTELTNLRSRKRASWFFDAALYPRRWTQIIDAFGFDCNFMANANMLYNNLKTEYLPYAASAIHCRPFNHFKQRAFGFIGSDRPERQALAAQLSFANVELKSGIFREEFIDYLASSCYTINDIAGGGVGLIPMRPFEALAAGSCLITPKNDGVRSLGLPCIEYGSQEELVSICRHLYDDNIMPDSAGQEAVLRNHMYKHRCSTILTNLFKYDA
jgi:hypothetical protein